MFKCSENFECVYGPFIGTTGSRRQSLVEVCKNNSIIVTSNSVDQVFKKNVNNVNEWQCQFPELSAVMVSVFNKFDFEFKETLIILKSETMCIEMFPCFLGPVTDSCFNTITKVVFFRICFHTGLFLRIILCILQMNILS